jgi:elongation factor Ts
MYKATMSDIKSLRSRSGAGIKDCKTALVENDGDIQAAMDWLRAKGIAKAAKKSGRIATEGAIHSHITSNVGALIEVNCETDFVARTDGFKEFVSTVASHVVKYDVDSVDELLAQEWSEGGTIAEAVQQMVFKTGENIRLRRFSRYDLQGSGIVHSYIHTGARLGVMVEVASTSAVDEFADDLAMHIAASRPDYVSDTHIPKDVVAKEFEIQKARVIEEGKPEHIAVKVVTGRIAKWKKEISLYDQVWIHDDNDQAKVKSVLKDLSGDVDVRRFSTFALGEGLEKKENNFAEEVAAMTS